MRYASFLLLSLCLVACTVAPPLVTSSTVAYSGAYQDAGIISWAYDSKGNRVGAYVRLDYVQNYRLMVKAYGSHLKPPLTEPRAIVGTGNGLYAVDNETLAQYAMMTAYEMNP